MRKTRSDIKKNIAYKDGTYSIEPNLPLPVVLYPGFYGSFFAFKETELDSKIYLCKCSKIAVEHFIKYCNMHIDSLYNRNISYTHEFPVSFLEYINEPRISDIGDQIHKMGDCIYKDKICHICNKATPSYSYCDPMYGSRFKQNYGWYINLKLFEYGIYSSAYDESFIPDNLKSIIDELQELSRESDIDSKRINQIENYINNYAENAIREIYGHPLIGRRWNNESNLFDYTCEIFGSSDVKFHYRPEWLDGLEIDIFVISKNLGIEYQGIQHYKPFKHWGGESAFLSRRINDIKKSELCKRNNVDLIYFTYEDILTKDFVMQKLSQYL